MNTDKLAKFRSN